jgi:hypothetical protein
MPTVQITEFHQRGLDTNCERNDKNSLHPAYSSTSSTPVWVPNLTVNVSICLENILNFFS